MPFKVRNWSVAASVTTMIILLVINIKIIHLWKHLAFNIDLMFNMTKAICLHICASSSAYYHAKAVTVPLQLSRLPIPIACLTIIITITTVTVSAFTELSRITWEGYQGNGVMFQSDSSKELLRVSGMWQGVKASVFPEVPEKFSAIIFNQPPRLPHRYFIFSKIGTKALCITTRLRVWLSC